MAVERYETLLPRDLGQVVLVGVLEVERAAECAARRRFANVRASSNSWPAVESIAVGSKCPRVLEESFRYIVAFLHCVRLVVALSRRVGTLAEEDTTSFSLSCDWFRQGRHTSGCCDDCGDDSGQLHLDSWRGVEVQLRIVVKKDVVTSSS